MELVSLRDIIAPMWFVYILQCRDRSLYTGVAKDSKERFREHVSGKGGAYTRSHKPLRIVHLEPADSYSAALKREHKIKCWGRLKKVKTLGLTAL